MRASTTRCACAVWVSLLVGASAAGATTISYTGNLRSDATVTTCQGQPCTLVTDGDYAQYAAVVESFSLGQSSAVSAVTFSYGGGVNGRGITIAAGGFSPYLSLFDSAGNFLASTYSGTYCPAGANTFGGSCNDVLLDAGVLGPGSYQIALTAYLNQSFAENLGSGTLADGFTGLGNLDGTLDYAFDVDITPTSVPPPPPPPTIPEPASITLVATAVAGQLAWWRRRAKVPQGVG